MKKLVTIALILTHSNHFYGSSADSSAATVDTEENKAKLVPLYAAKKEQQSLFLAEQFTRSIIIDESNRTYDEIELNRRINHYSLSTHNDLLSEEEDDSSSLAATVDTEENDDSSIDSLAATEDTEENKAKLVPLCAATIGTAKTKIFPREKVQQIMILQEQLGRNNIIDENYIQHSKMMDEMDTEYKEIQAIRERNSNPEKDELICYEKIYRECIILHEKITREEILAEIRQTKILDQVRRYLQRQKQKQ